MHEILNKLTVRTNTKLVFTKYSTDQSDVKIDLYKMEYLFRNNE